MWIRNFSGYDSDGVMQVLTVASQSYLKMMKGFIFCDFIDQKRVQQFVVWMFFMVYLFKIVWVGVSEHILNKKSSTVEIEIYRSMIFCIVWNIRKFKFMVKNVARKTWSIATDILCNQKLLKVWIVFMAELLVTLQRTFEKTLFEKTSFVSGCLWFFFTMAGRQNAF